jgi:proline iminopeptidase
MTTREGYVTTDDGLRLFYQQCGDGPALTLFLNGVPLVDDFAALAPEGSGRSIVCFDNRGRGRSDTLREPAQIERGIHHDVDDLDTLRRHFGAEQVSVIGHSYAATTAVLYAMTYPAHTDRIVQIGPIGPDANRQYPAELSYVDDTFRVAMAGLSELVKDYGKVDPVEMCRRFWSVLAPIYVVDPADVSQIRWMRCDLANERNFMPVWTQHLQPSIQQLKLGDEQLARATSPVLVVHGRKDRSAPYGGGRDWARVLPHARLLTIDHASHAPWIEARQVVLDAMRTFFDGAWPDAAEAVVS